jgi:hypothetical protein
MLENSVWKQYNQEINFNEVLNDFYKEEVSLSDDELFLHNVLKAKLTKKEFRLFAMDCAKIADNVIKEKFSYNDDELKNAREKLYKKLKQDKIKRALKEE